MKIIFISIIYIVVASLLTSAKLKEQVSKISIENKSLFEFHSVQLSNAGKNNWGVNLLNEGDVLFPSIGAMMITADCGVFDVRLTDADGKVCLLQSIDVCQNNKTIIIQDSLINCSSD